MRQIDRRASSATPAVERLERAHAARAVRAVEDLRIAEAQLARRRQNDAGPNQTARDVLRLVIDAADRGERITPTQIAKQTRLTSASITPVLKRLVADGLVTVAPSPEDARSKTVAPTDRAEPDESDRLAERIAEAASALDPSSAAAVASFLDRVRAIVDDECR